MRKLTEQQRADRLAKLAALRAEIAALRAARHKAPRKARGFALLPMLALLAIGAAAVFAGHSAELRTREAAALHCARVSDGADGSIADCYTSRDLSIPEDL